MAHTAAQATNFSPPVLAALPRPARLGVDRPMVACVPMFCAVLFGGCAGQGTPGVGGARRPDPLSGGWDKPLAMCGPRAVYWGDLAPALLETAGAIALEECALDAALDGAIAQSGLVLTPAMIQAERTALDTMLRDRADIDAGQSRAQVDRIRAARGLGPARFERLLARNAKLRMLAGNVAQPTEEEISREATLAASPRVRARVIRTADPSLAAQLRTRAAAAPNADARSLVFAECAMQHSLDSSGVAGGLVPAASASDPAIPAELRGALASLREGAVSEVLVVGGASWLVLVESRTASGAEAASTREVLVARFLVQKQRVAMDALAARLLAGSKPTVLDASLGWAWDHKGGR